MEDQHSELKYPLRGTLATLVLLFLGLCIFNWHAFRDHGLMAGFRSLRWDTFFGMTVGFITGWIMRQPPKEITTLGVGEITAKKLQ
jgi:hypothetical protein